MPYFTAGLQVAKWRRIEVQTIFCTFCNVELGELDDYFDLDRPRKTGLSKLVTGHRDLSFGHWESWRRMLDEMRIGNYLITPRTRL